MDDKNDLLAGILSAGAEAFAGDAAQALLEAMPAGGAGFAPAPFDGWRTVLAGRLQELAAAVASARPALFAAQVAWARELLAARGVSPEEFKTALACVRHVLKERLPERVRDDADSYLTAALENFDGRPEPAAPSLSSDRAADRLAAQYLLAVLEGNPHAARERMLACARQGWSVRDLFVDVLAPAAEEIGRMWHCGEITVSEEHLATATTRILLAQLAAQATPAPANGKTVLLTTVVGNQHDLGAQMLAHLFELDGWRSLWLGPDIPPEDLAAAVEFFESDLLALSVALTLHLPSVRATIAMVRRGTRGGDVVILAGGSAIGGDKELAAQLGADGSAENAIDALALANRLCAGKKRREAPDASCGGP